MEVPQLSPEGILLPPSPVESDISDDSTNSGTATEGTPKPDRPENVMITLSPVPSPSRSPFPRSHFRSRSLAEVSGIPPMTRAHSSPGLDSRGRYIFVNREMPSNLLDNAPRRYMPLQITTGENLEARMMPLNISEPIFEHVEFDPTMRSSPSQPDGYTSSPVLSHTLPRTGRRRPSSPLHFHIPNSSGQPVGSPQSVHASPVILASKYNESFPGYSSSGSSIPSTPTSIRSRSPSISSLETIPDIPDAEVEALEADRIAALKAAADRADEAEAATNGNRRRGISDASGPSTMRAGSGVYGVRADKRKRWSVCGAERRQDLDLETIWED